MEDPQRGLKQRYDVARASVYSQLPCRRMAESSAAREPEAFPNAFLRVFTPEAEMLSAPKLKRGRRFDCPYERIVKNDPKDLGEICICKIYRPNLTISLANPIE
jgi:hypothetical protein